MQPKRFYGSSYWGWCCVQEPDGCWVEAVREPKGHGFQMLMRVWPWWAFDLWPLAFGDSRLPFWGIVSCRSIWRHRGQIGKCLHRFKLIYRGPPTLLSYFITCCVVSAIPGFISDFQHLQCFHFHWNIFSIQTAVGRAMGLETICFCVHKVHNKVMTVRTSDQIATYCSLKDIAMLTFDKIILFCNNHPSKISCTDYYWFKNSFI